MKIMVVDDEEDIKLLFKYKFKKEISEHSIDFSFKLSAIEAIEYLQNEKNSDLVLILSDINMPGMTGLELLKFLKEKYPEIKVFIITAYGDRKNFDKAMEFGADDFITKPINFNELKEKMHRVLDNQK